MPKKNTITILPQVVDGGNYDIFASFFYLKHYHEKKTIFVEVCREGINVVSPKYKDDKKLVVINKRYTTSFHRFLNYVSEQLEGKDVYMSLNGPYAQDLLKMFTDISSYKLSFQEALSKLKHDLDFKVFLSMDRSESTYPFAVGLYKNLPNNYKLKIYLDSNNYGYFGEVIIDSFRPNTVVEVHGFYKNCWRRDEIIKFFNNQLEDMHDVLVVKPILEMLNV